jgi:hypothetical protein
VRRLILARQVVAKASRFRLRRAHNRSMDHPDGMHVYLEVEASAEEVAAVAQALREAGIDAPVEACYERSGIGTYPWILEISGTAAALFFAGFLGAAGSDAWKNLKALIVKLHEARAGSRAPKGIAILIDEPTGEWILIRDDLPDEAGSSYSRWRSQRRSRGS